MIGELITAGAGLLGSLFGSKKKQTTTTRVDYGRMVKDATAAGFNPLTALRNGGSAGFTTTTGPTLSNLPEALGSLGGVLGDALENKIDPLKKKQRELDTALVDYQLRQLKQGPGMFYPGSTYTGTKVTGRHRQRLGRRRKSRRMLSVRLVLTCLRVLGRTERYSPPWWRGVGRTTR
ncbi:hypothetical protein [Rhizobium sp. BG4]|uniref:hypothetical protein n=1 Tax=Rhizobium sp. BG4 TaxID=2613770 RepID=UPI00193CAC32|nr:hypothetical protein [Rhizobium sp. BG4]QRM46016.1 hypothetical protein F2982_21610 [Rhizobium sp. BG4]